MIKVLFSVQVKTPRNCEFKPQHVHSIYKKGKLREARLNSKDVVEISDVMVNIL